MSKKANPAFIGVFVIIAAAILMGGVVILGSGKLFADTTEYVLFFEGDLSGLDVGAPVEYRGVRLGTVSDIRLEYDTENGEVSIPVYIELDENRVDYLGANGTYKGVEHHTQRGLRAQLQSQSFVTGKLKVGLVEAPNTPIRLVGADPTVAELATIPGMLQSLVDEVEGLPLEAIVRDVHAGTQALAEIAKSGALQAIVESLRAATDSLAEMTASGELEAIVRDVRAGADALAQIAESGELSGIVGDIRKGTRTLAEIAESGALPEIVTELKNTLASVDETLQETQQTLVELRDGVKPLRRETMMALEEFSHAARSARQLLDYLERHPEALLQGKESK